MWLVEVLFAVALEAEVMRMARLVGQFALGMVIAVMTADPIHASWIAPQRPMSDKEWLAYEISDADAVGLGHLLAVHDTVVDITSDGSGYPSRTVIIRVKEWLKGGGGASITAGVSMLSNWPFPWEAVSPLPPVGNAYVETPWVVFMLRRLPTGWGILDGPYGSGIRSAPRGSRDTLYAAVRRCVAEQRPDSLLRSADAVLVGRAIGTSPCISGSLTCSEVVVDQVLGGQVSVGQTVSVFTPTRDLIEKPMLYVLRLDSDGVYERLGQLSGSQPLKDGVAERWKMTVEEVGRRYRQLRNRSADRSVVPRGRKSR